MPSTSAEVVNCTIAGFGPVATETTVAPLFNESLAALKAPAPAFYRTSTP